MLGDGILIFFKIYLSLERGEREGEREGRETLMCESNVGCLSQAPSGHPAHNPGTCPDQELNP